MLSIFISANLFGQWNFSISTSQEYNNNPFHYPDQTSSFISSLNLGIEHEIKSFGLGYYGNYSNFNNMTDRNFYWHQFGFWNATNNLMFGLYVEQRINQLEYEYFDYSNYNAYIKHKASTDGFTFLTQAAFTLTSYDQLSDLNNWMGSIGTSINKSFESKTTIIGGVNFNYKNYYETNLDTTETMMMNSRRFSYTESNSAYTTQLNYYLRLAQSLTETTGLALQYTGRNIIDGTAKTVRELEYAYGDESQYFDDPISYEGYTLNSQITQILPSEITLRLSYFYNYKEYPSQGIYLNEEEIDDNTIRLDEQHIFNLSLSKTVYLGNENDYALYLSLSYQMINNLSNSYWYDYKANSFNMGIDFQF
ncbi:MAG: hypothetical protein H6611_01390 [Ignavibacteriales bacterium]|nr:hypothetical protein [Ignavibacteriales bacterium]MCB9209240.1 hypothetical protein [Ignavibacteriales bacterium]